MKAFIYEFKYSKLQRTFAGMGAALQDQQQQGHHLYVTASVPFYKAYPHIKIQL